VIGNMYGTAAMTRDRANQGHVAVVFGSTGTAGMGVVHACLADPGVSVVRAITRRPLSISHPKLHRVHCSEFVNLEGIAQQFEVVDCCLFCLGTSVRNVNGEDEYREQLKEKLRAEDAAGYRADRSADQEAAHAGVISVTFQGTT
jgi:hypothetical protein